MFIYICIYTHLYLFYIYLNRYLKDKTLFKTVRGKRQIEFLVMDIANYYPSISSIINWHQKMTLQYRHSQNSWSGNSQKNKQIQPSSHQSCALKWDLFFPIKVESYSLRLNSSVQSIGKHLGRTSICFDSCLHMERLQLD